MGKNDLAELWAPDLWRRALNPAATRVHTVLARARSYQGLPIRAMAWCVHS
jgi:hypothetical protein